MNTKPEEETQHSTTTTTHQHQPTPSSSTSTTTNPPAPAPAPQPQPQPQPESDPNNTNNDSEKWGTDTMGPPAAPSSHPNNQKAAALWSGGEGEGEGEQHQPQHPYVLYSPVAHKSTGHNPMEPVINVFNSWSSKAETLARNIWQNLKTGPSVSEAVYGKVGLSTKVITGGGFESLYKQTFTTAPNDKLKKTFACYLSTLTGPVAGTLYLSNFNVAFCSDRPLSFTAPSGQLAWSYYKVMIPLSKINSIDPITMTDNPSEKYIKIDTVDSHDFWFMAFVNYDKASRHLSHSFSEFNTATAAEASPPPPPVDGSSVVG